MSQLPEPLIPYNPIHDPIHGRIWLTEVEMELVNTPEFQRLRRISQLSPVDYVFPGSTHSRFCHSLGATYVMGLILARPKLQEHFGDRPYMVQILRLAALLHDIGHVPFSHVGETAWNASRKPGWEKYTETDYETALDVVAANVPGAYHEELSALVVRSERVAEIINRHISREETGEGPDGLDSAELVARIIKGIPTEADKGDAVVHGLLSSELDCDRLDYLLRDSHAAGLTYGQADLWYLIENMVIAEDDEIGKVLAIDEKHGKTTCEHYLLARYYHYAQLVSHKTVGAAELALGAAILELIRIGELPTADALEAAITEPADAEYAFAEVTDDRVLSLLAEGSRAFRNEPYLNDYARRVIERKLPKIAADKSGLEELRGPDSDLEHTWDTRLPKERPEAKQTIAEECNIDAEYFSYCRSSRTLVGLDPVAVLAEALGSDRKGIKTQRPKAAMIAKHGGPPRPLLLASPLIETIARRRWVTRRVLALEPLDSYSGGDKQRSEGFERLKEYFEVTLRPGAAA